MKRILTIILSCAVLAACASNRPPADHVALPQAPPPGEPPGLIGLSAGALTLALGSPAFTRKDGTAELWRYDSKTCRAWFFLYPDNSVLVVRHVETSPRPADASFDAGCLTSLRRAPSPVS